MFITDKFLFIHEPKTGGTFVYKILARIHEARGETVEVIYRHAGDTSPLNPPAGRAVRLMQPNQHVRASEIPPDLRQRTIIATIRNPYDRYVSQYEFAWWRREPTMFGAVDEVKRQYPNFPDLTFEQFIELANRTLIKYHNAEHPEDTPGFHTQQFVEFFFNNPAAVYPRLNADYIARREYENDMPPIRWLKTHRLNADLHGFLLEMGYAPDEIAFVLNAEKIFPPEGGRTDDQTWDKYFTPALKASVRQKERLLFAIFPEFDYEG
jgi:hypothetical protein